MILVLETGGATTHIYLYEDDKSSAQLEWESGRELSAQLLSRLTGFLAEKHIGLDDLSGIVIFSGPGSFTSLRIGHSVANALADSLAIPVVGADGDGWIRSGLSAVKTAQPGRPAMPNYGAEANITKPKS